MLLNQRERCALRNTTIILKSFALTWTSIWTTNQWVTIYSPCCVQRGDSRSRSRSWRCQSVCSALRGCWQSSPWASTYDLAEATGWSWATECSVWQVEPHSLPMSCWLLSSWWTSVWFLLQQSPCMHRGIDWWIDECPWLCWQDLMCVDVLHHTEQQSTTYAHPDQTHCMIEHLLCTVELLFYWSILSQLLSCPNPLNALVALLTSTWLCDPFIQHCTTMVSSSHE